MLKKNFDFMSPLFLISILLLPASLFAEVSQFTINFKTESIVIGPQITLGEVGQIIVADKALRHRLNQLEITKAAPPGEAKEITVSQIKKCVREEGFDLAHIIFKGPKILRITTLPDKLINLIIEDKLALFRPRNLSCSYSGWQIHGSRFPVKNVVNLQVSSSACCQA